MSSQEILDLLARLEAAIAERRRCADRRGDLIAAFRRTGIRADEDAFGQAVCDLQAASDQVRALQSALDALRGAAR